MTNSFAHEQTPIKTYTAQEISSSANTALLNDIIHLISLAFTNDPSHKWLFFNHTHEAFATTLPKYIRVVINLSIASDALFTVITHSADDNLLRAIAITVPPHGHATYDSMLAGIRAGGYTLPFTCGPRFSWRLLVELLPSLERMYDEVFPVKREIWHLFYLATYPESQGQGLGSKLLKEVQERVRKDRGVPLYLEASSVENRRLYARLGFVERASMVYGVVREGEDVRVDEMGRVLGGRQFGMIWDPELGS